jgi:hypothetical protein
VADLTGSAKFTANQPDAVVLLSSFEAPRRRGAQYGQRLSGLLVPPTTGAYVFFIASDNDSELWLSTDSTAQNKLLIASVAGFTGSREWNKYPDTQNNAQAPVTLQAGQHYYLEALMKEDDGEDNLAVGWVLPGQTVDPWADPPCRTREHWRSSRAACSVRWSKRAIDVTITTGPANATSSLGGHASFPVQRAVPSREPPCCTSGSRTERTCGANRASYITPN